MSTSWFDNIFPCFRQSEYQHAVDIEPLVNNRTPKKDPKSDDDFAANTRQKIIDFSEKITSQPWRDADMGTIIRDYIKCFFEDRSNIDGIEEEIRKLMKKSDQFRKKFFESIQAVGKSELSYEKHTKLSRHMVVLL